MAKQRPPTRDVPQGAEASRAEPRLFNVSCILQVWARNDAEAIVRTSLSIKDTAEDGFVSSFAITRTAPVTDS